VEADETLLEVTEETSDAAELPSDTVERPSLSGRRTAGGREMDRFRVKAELEPVFLVLSSEDVCLESDLFLGGLPRIVRAMAVSCWRCCSYCDSGSKGRRVGGAACLVGFCDFLIFLMRLLAVILLLLRLRVLLVVYSVGRGVLIWYGRVRG
jgi:hypothetical protein